MGARILRYEDEAGLDLALVLDTTGSMGTYLAEISRQLLEVVSEIHQHVVGVRCGVIAFKDHGEQEDYLTHSLPLSRNLHRLVSFMHDSELKPGVGGGGAEAVECALHEANALPWRKHARKAILLIGDKPPHGGGLDSFSACTHGIDYRDEIEELAGRGVAIYTLQVGDCLQTRRMFEYFSARTGGTFLDGLHIRDLPSSIASVCHKEAGDLADYRQRLARAGRLTETRRVMIHSLAS